MGVCRGCVPLHTLASPDNHRPSNVPSISIHTVQSPSPTQMGLWPTRARFSSLVMFWPSIHWSRGRTDVDILNRYIERGCRGCRHCRTEGVQIHHHLPGGISPFEHFLSASSPLVEALLRAAPLARQYSRHRWKRDPRVWKRNVPPIHTRVESHHINGGDIVGLDGCQVLRHVPSCQNTTMHARV